MKRLITLGLVALAAACSNNSYTAPGGGNPPPPPPPPPSGSVAVSISDFAFTPDSVGITVGQTVVWTNHGPSAHTVTAGNASFDSGVLNNGATFSHTFTTAGPYSYHCTIHPQMSGIIIVNPKP